MTITMPDSLSLRGRLPVVSNSMLYLGLRWMPWTALRKARSRILTDIDTDTDTPPKC